jgi:hypothetical protein
VTNLSLDVRPSTYQRLLEVADQHGTSLTDALERVVEEWYRHRIFTQAAEAYATLRADPLEYAEWRAEIAAWDVTLGDGLEPEDWHAPEGDIDAC